MFYKLCTTSAFSLPYHSEKQNILSDPGQIIFQDLGYKQLCQCFQVISQIFRNIIPYISAETKSGPEKFTGVEHLIHCGSWKGSLVIPPCFYMLFPSFYYWPITVTGCLARQNSGLSHHGSAYE